MKKVVLFTLILFLPFCYAFISSSNTEIKTSSNGNDDITIYNFEELEPLLYTKSDKIHIVNFWAMWCAPCIKELPILQEYEKNHPNVEVLLVSMDFPKNIESKLIPFLKKKGVSSKVVLLDDPDANSWIDKVDPNWSGSIPFTIIFNNKARSFHERAFENIQDLESEINKTIKSN